MKSRGKALYLTYDGLTDPLGQSQVLPYLIGLSQRGWKFSIISFEKKDAFDQLENLIRSQLETHHITWFPKPYTKKPPVLSTVYDLWKMRKIARSLELSSYDIIHCRSYLTMLVGIGIAEKQRLIFDMRGFWADERVEGNLWPQRLPLYRWIYHYFKRKEQQFLEQATAVVSLTEDGILALKERYGEDVAKSKFTVIPCCVDVDLFNLEKTPLFSKKSLGFDEDARILIHVGSVGTWYRFDQELRFFEALHGADPRWRFLVLTKDIERAKDTFERTALSSEFVVFTSANYTEVPSYLSIAEASIQLIEPSYAKRASSPVKLAECMAMGLPVIANTGIGDVHGILRTSNGGVVVSSWEELPAVARAWNPSLYNPEAIRSYALTHFSAALGIERYAAIYEGKGTEQNQFKG